MTEQQNPFDIVEENSEKISPKSKIVTGLLAIFLGQYGVDQFYLGKVKEGIISICITVGCIAVAGVLGFILGLLSIVTFGITLILAFPVGMICGLGAWVWPIIRAIRVFTGKEKDKDGYPILN